MKNLTKFLQPHRIRRGKRRDLQGGDFTGRFKFSFPGTAASHTNPRKVYAKVFEGERWRLVRFSIRERKPEQGRWRERRPTLVEVNRVRLMFFNPEDNVIMSIPYRTRQQINDFSVVELWEPIGEATGLPNEQVISEEKLQLGTK